LSLAVGTLGAAGPFWDPPDSERKCSGHDAPFLTSTLSLHPPSHSDSLRTIVLAGIAGLVAGALSMAVGEYISMSSQR